MGETTKQSVISILISAFGLFIGGTALFFLLGLNSKWNQVPLLTGEVLSVHKPIRDIGLTPIENVNNVLSSGVSGVDYVVKIPIDQPNISSNKVEENNNIIHNYLYKNRLTFSLPTGKNGLLLIITNKPLANDRNLLFAIGGATRGELHKDKGMITDADNKYLFDINNLPVASFVPSISLFDNTIDGKVQLGVFAAESDNYVEKLIMVFY